MLGQFLQTDLKSLLLEKIPEAALRLVETATPLRIVSGLVDLVESVAENCQAAEEFVKKILDGLKSAIREPASAVDYVSRRTTDALSLSIVPALKILARLARIDDFPRDFNKAREKVIDKVDNKLRDLFKKVLAPLEKLFGKLPAGKQDSLVPPATEETESGQETTVYVDRDTGE